MRFPAIAILVAALVVLVLIFVMPLTTDHGDKVPDLSKLVPESTGEWTTSGEDGLYDRETIFDYMDGAGEVFLSFAYRQLLVRRYTKKPEEELTVELYDMGNSSDAFGIFSRTRSAGDAGIGQGSQYWTGQINFWKGRYYVSVYLLEETDETRNDLFNLAGRISDNITETGELPGIVTMLPQEDLLPYTIRYFHLHTDLNRHYFLADANILELDADTEAVIANYERGEDYSFLLLVKYPDEERAGAAHTGFLDAYMPEAKDTGTVQVEDGYWAAVSQMGTFIIAVFDAGTSERARELISAARDSMEGTL